jgi:hypothetical protein
MYRKMNQTEARQEMGNRESMRIAIGLEKPTNVWESLQDVNLHDLRPLGGSYILMAFLNI